MEYYIAVQIAATLPMNELSEALQSAYDDGAAGSYEILVSNETTYMVIFKRYVYEDAEYVSARANSPEVSIEKAAMQQLAAELTESAVTEALQPIIDVLTAGEAKCFDFGAGAFAEMAEYDADEEVQQAQGA